MAENEPLKICEAEGDSCKKEVQALCYHCSKNLCRTHLMRHAQLVEEKIVSELHSLAGKINELLSRFSELSIPDDIREKPFDQLEVWRLKAHEVIDQIAERKHRELNYIIGKYHKSVLTENEERLEKLRTSKKMLAELIEEADASSTQLTNLQRSINEAETYLDTLKTPEIEFMYQPPNWPIDIRSSGLDMKSVSVLNIREFKIIYVRLNGKIQAYNILSKKDEKMSDLKNDFIEQYHWGTKFRGPMWNSIETTNDNPQFDFIFSSNVLNHRYVSQLTDETLLSDIADRKVIVFNETPYSLADPNASRILMPCTLQRRPTYRSFGVPICLCVPRRGCRGQDIRDALDRTLRDFFSLDPNSDKYLYKATVDLTVNGNTQKKDLNDILQDDINFNTTNAQLTLAFNRQFADNYQETCLDKCGF